ncbi:uncharacterized protein [Epargyreus clarus]|uniref:uncharacterized protein n=1 Tax=Epargyreus clarus TaxID=520877 RepID=UPI003C2EF011
MNGDEKEEAQRPRPLSGGIWTLFSWLRRSERSSSSDSLSSVGSARTAASFDFLAPGNCDFTSTPIVLTTPIPPSETYKKRLQERNLRRQRDRDITLHRKYGLVREFGSGYDGFSLPPVRRVFDSPVSRQNRERRATSECLQRRAAYVPGKRRAPLPPAITTSATLPRSYKRKRPAPKPPVKSAVKENKDQQIHHSTRMNSNPRPVEKINPDIELFSSKTEKCDKSDKKATNSKDTKSKTDKNFLKHIFENRKRNSAIETPTLRLLPSISELDKQAAEIIEHNKLRHNRNSVLDENLGNSQNSSTSYEINTWFCTSCLRKYDSSVNSCNYCLPENKHISKNADRDGLKQSSPRSSIYTQTNSNGESATSSQSSMDERKILKELLKEMKDSLPKKHKNKANMITETPTLRIGSTVDEAYKDLMSQPSSSSDLRLNNMVNDDKKCSEASSSNRISITSLLSESQGNSGRYVVNQNIASSSKSSDISNKNVIHHKVTLAFEDRVNFEKTSSKIPVHSQPSTSRDNPKEKYKIVEHSPDVARNRKTDKPIENVQMKNSNIMKNTSNNKSELSSLSTKTNENKELTNNLRISNEKFNSILERRETEFRDKVPEATTNNESQLLSSAVKTNVSTESPITKPTPPKMLFLNFPITNAVVVNSVTVVTSPSNNKSSETQKELSMKNVENHSTSLSASKAPNETQSSNKAAQLKSLPQPTISSQTPAQSKADPVKSTTASVISVKPESNLHTPLKISTLLNPFYTPRLPVIKEDKKPGPDDGEIEKQQRTDLNIVKNNNIHQEENKLKISSQPSAPSISQLKEKHKQNDTREPLQKEAVKTETTSKHITTNMILNKQEVLPSTSGCSKSVTNNSNSNEDKLDQYDRRRHLIQQLEQSIAKGDETAAAEAAAKLAKLRLSCSVLSFSSQIIGESSNQNGRVSENVGLKQNKTELQTGKKSDQNVLQTPKEVDQVCIKDTRLKTNETVQKTSDGEELPKKDVVQLNVKSESNLTNPPHAYEPSSSTTKPASGDILPIEVWVEDKQAARGPIRLRISRQATMADLRRQAEHSLGLASQLQRWIIGRTLCTDDATTIVSVAGPDLKAPFYLCLVQSETNEKAATEAIGGENDTKNDNTSNQNGEFYTELMKLEKQSLVPNIEPFECGVCMEECAAGAGVVLRECIHTFCRECLSDVVQHSQEPVVSCPAMGCSGVLQEREIRNIVSPEEYERWLARSLAAAECGTRNAFHCRTRDCTGWAFCDPGVRRFPCPVCKHTNCVQCQAIHEGETCEQYQVKLREAVAAAEINKDDEGTQSLINSLIARGEALECPECKAIITKKWGCDWVKCSACKTEICWVTKGRRWGPGGRGDTSGGCRCGVDGQRCHPSCGYCH